MAKTSGLRVCFFDQVAGKKVDKIFINKTDKQDDIYITFEGNDVVKIEVSSIKSMVWKDEASTHHALKIEI